MINVLAFERLCCLAAVFHDKQIERFLAIRASPIVMLHLLRMLAPTIIVSMTLPQLYPMRIVILHTYEVILRSQMNNIFFLLLCASRAKQCICTVFKGIQNGSAFERNHLFINKKTMLNSIIRYSDKWLFGAYIWSFRYLDLIITSFMSHLWVCFCLQRVS